MAMYFGLITLIDHNIGRILSELDAQGLTENTLIIFTADHGDFSGEHGFFHKNLGMYEAIVHIPYIAAGPGIAAGKVSAELVEQVDIFPTACEAAGVPVPESVQGLSLLELDKWPRKAAFHETEERKGIRTAQYRRRKS
jgi:arylsulfatase A-like enzyme